MNTGNFLRPLGWPPASVAGRRARHWLGAARAWYDKRREAGSARLHDSLLELDARTLRDIGAPPALQARAQRRRQAQRDRCDDLRAGGAAGDWQGW